MVKKILFKLGYGYVALGNLIWMVVPKTALAKDLKVVDYFPAIGKMGAKGVTIGAVGKAAALPEVSLADLITQVIKIAIMISSPLVFIAFVMGGIQYIIARGEEEAVNNAHSTITYAIVGTIIIATSYALILGISRLTYEDYIE